MVPGEQTNI